MLLIITGTITPMVSSTELVIKNQKERLQQYIDSIQYFMESKAFQKIIFGENSSFPREQLECLFQSAQENGVQFEYLTFEGNSNQTRLLGKGYGEGEIMKYIFTNSQLLKEETDFMKVTGRLKLVNVEKIVSMCHTGKTYMNIPNRTIRNWYDTRVYVMPVAQFANLFLEIYSNVDDKAGEYLEVVYTKSIIENHIKVKNFPRYPRILGLSGSTGSSYVYTEWKCLIKDFFSKLQFYQVKM